METIEGIADFTMSVTSIVPFEVVLEVVFRRLLFVDVVACASVCVEVPNRAFTP